VISGHDGGTKLSISGRFRFYPCSTPEWIASIILVLAFVWVIWISLGTFKAWQNGQVALFDVIWSALRASIVLMVLGFYLR